MANKWHFLLILALQLKKRNMIFNMFWKNLDFLIQKWFLIWQLTPQSNMNM